MSLGKQALLITVAYAAAVVCAALLFWVAEYATGYTDARNEQVTTLFGVIVFVLWLRSLRAIYRPRVPARDNDHR